MLKNINIINTYKIDSNHKEMVKKSVKSKSLKSDVGDKKTGPNGVKLQLLHTQISSVDTSYISIKWQANIHQNYY